MELFYETEAVNSAQVIYSSALFKCVRFTAFARFALRETMGYCQIFRAKLSSESCHLDQRKGTVF